jgi:hypothetical protein
VKLPLLIFCLTLSLSALAQKSDKLAVATSSLAQLDTLVSDKKIDSLNQKFTSSADSLHSLYRAEISELNSKKQALQNNIDSLSNLQLPTQNFSNKLDSINQKYSDVINEYPNKAQQLQQRYAEKLNSLNLPHDKLQKANDIIEKYNIPSLPSSNFEGHKLPHLGNPDVNAILKTEQSIPVISNITGIELPDEIKGVAGNVSSVTGNLSEVQNGANAIKDPLVISKTLENKVVENSGVKDVLNDKGSLSELEKLKSEEAVKEQLKEEVKEAAIDHFAGKQEVLQDALQQISRYKKKYSSLNSLSEIGKRRPNPMKGKPFIERTVPGVFFQFHSRGGYVLLDVNPYAGYKLSGRLTAGLGWLQRGVVRESRNLLPTEKINVYGPRVFAEFLLPKGFLPRLEIEYVNTYVPTFQSIVTKDIGRREWVPGAFIGLKKQYKIYKNIRGTAIINLRLFNPSFKSPYGDVVNTRFGFEFPIKKGVSDKSR